jgi:hypothetical protein
VNESKIHLESLLKERTRDTEKVSILILILILILIQHPAS